MNFIRKSIIKDRKSVIKERVCNQEGKLLIKSGKLSESQQLREKGSN